MQTYVASPSTRRNQRSSPASHRPTTRSPSCWAAARRIACAPPIGTISMPSSARSRPSFAATASSAIRSVMPFDEDDGHARKLA